MIKCNAKWKFVSLFYFLFISLLYSNLNFEMEMKFSTKDLHVLILFQYFDHMLCSFEFYMRSTYSVFGFGFWIGMYWHWTIKMIDVEMNNSHRSRLALVRKIQIIPGNNNCIIRNFKCSELILILCLQIAILSLKPLTGHQRKNMTTKNQEQIKKCFLLKIFATRKYYITLYYQRIEIKMLFNVITQWFCPTFSFLSIKFNVH